MSEIKSSITDAFEKINEKYGIAMNDIRVQIAKDGLKLDLSVLNKTTRIDKTSLGFLIGNTYAMMAKIPLANSIKKLYSENGLNEERASVLLYLQPDQSPSGYVYYDGNPFKQVDIDELIN